jgi:hypothetical protein
LAFWTLEQMIADKAFVPGRVLDAFTSRDSCTRGGRDRSLYHFVSRFAGCKNFFVASEVL